MDGWVPYSADPPRPKSLWQRLLDATVGRNAGVCLNGFSSDDSEAVTTGDPRLTDEERRTLWYDFRGGELPDAGQLRAIVDVLTRAASRTAGETEASREIAYALGVVDEMGDPPTEADLDDLFWSLSNLLDMPY